MNFFDDTNDNSAAFSAFYEKQLYSISLPAKLSENFTLKNCLKQSKHREIYLLTDKKDNLYILKKQSGKQILQLKQEQQIFEILNDIKDFSIPQFIDCWEEQDCCYLLRTYIEGLSLSDYFNHHLHLSDREIIHYMLAICDLISTLHHQQPPVIHRDIKPENFIIQKGTGILYLIDFDTARVYMPNKSRDTMLIGTPSHAAPEQFGFSQSDVRTDIYAMGKTLLYLACGSTELTNLDLSSIAKPFRKMIVHCTDFAPEKRYSDINQLIRSLKNYQRHLNFSRFYARQAGTAIFLLAFGICLGYIMGSIQEKQDNNLANTNDLDKTESSLLEQSDFLQYDLSQFQDMANQIILDYYNANPDAMAKDCQILTKALYQNKALNQTAGTDYASLDEIHNKTVRAPILRIRDFLAYRNQILKRNQDSYDKYKDTIFTNMRNYLDPSITNTKNALYTYATSSGEKTVQIYPYALLDILYNIAQAFDSVDETANTDSN